MNNAQKTNVEKNLSDTVKNRVFELVAQKKLDLPSNYSVGNAITSAWLILQDTKDRNGNPVLKTCTKESIMNSLLDMAIMGLNPVKKQGYFIAYGDQLKWFTSYFGKCATIKRMEGIENEPIATIIYDGDEVEIGFNQLGEEIVLSHKTNWLNKLKGVRTGVYATCNVRGVKRSAIMTMSEVKESWTKNPSKGNQKDHVDFQGEFMKRTAINRLIKMILQTSNDDDLLADTMLRNEEENIRLAESEYSTVEEEIEENANQGEQLGFEEPVQQIQQPIDDKNIVEQYVKATSNVPESPKKSYF